MHTTLSIRLGHTGISHDLRYWLNSGLMTLFFLVVGLEARREFDMGELRDRRRVALPLAAGAGGMLVPIGIFLALNLGRGSAHGTGVWLDVDRYRLSRSGCSRSSASGSPVRLRAFMLTVSPVVDDVVALAVIATAYAGGLHRAPADCHAGGFFGMIVLATRLGIQRGVVYAALGVPAWVALSKSGVDPIVLGLVMGLLTFAAPATRSSLERASDLFRLFREQPTAEEASPAQHASASPPHFRRTSFAQQRFHPWTSYAIVPLFALANAGVHIDAHLLSVAFTAPVTLGILIGYVTGKVPVGIVAGSWLVTRLSRGRLRPPVGWAALAGGGAIAGVGFTVSLLIAGLAFQGRQLDEAKLGVLSAALSASVLTWLVFRATALLPRPLRIRALVGTAQPIIDLAAPVDPERDHIRGPHDAPVTLVEYGDFECPYCGQAESVIRELLRDSGDARYVWRHLPLTDVHPHAELAAEATEAAAAQNAFFWDMPHLLLEHQDALTTGDLVGDAEKLGLDVDRFWNTTISETHAGARPSGRGRRRRRPEQRLRYTDVLHQRPAPLRCL